MENTKFFISEVLKDKNATLIPPARLENQEKYSPSVVQISFENIEYGSMNYKKTLDLRNKVMRIPLGLNIYDEDFKMKDLRSKVGLVFQYPEYQLFEVDVFSDVCFGPKNLGLAKEEIEARATKALQAVGLKEKYYKYSPFELSGGQKRRVAIAGVLAMQPEVLILDEPTAGLDPKGRENILNLIARLHDEKGLTVIVVSHSMDDMAQYAKRLIVMNQGSVQYDGTPKEVFLHYRELEKVGLSAPKVTYIMHELAERGFPVDVTATTIEEAKKSILEGLKK